VDVDVRKDWPIPIRTLLKQMECATLGVAALHAAGLVLGDLKPETIIWDGDRAIVTDLKLAAPAGRRKNASFSPKFAAPEQILEKSAGPQADVYALGVTLYSLFVRDRFPSLLKTQEKTVGNGNANELSATTAFDHLNDGRPHHSQD
jgi:serine/threonine protein kinase